MGIKENIKALESKLPLTLVGVVLAIFFGVFGLYAAFHEKKPSLLVEITNESNVLDIHKPLKELMISFQGEDIQEKNLNLRISTIRIENNGELDILQNYYDRESIWGIAVQNAKIIEVRIVDTNSEYLSNQLKPQVLEENIVRLSKVIFEKDKFITLEVLSLHKRNQLPEINVIGKIAGIEKVEPIKTWMQDKQPFWRSALSGNLTVQAVRIIAYPLGALIALIIIGASITFMSSTNEKRKRRMRVKIIEEAFSSIVSDKKKLVLLVEEINNRKLNYLKELINILEDNKKLQILVKEYLLAQEYQKKRHGLRDGLDTAFDIRGTLALREHFLYPSNPIEYLIENDIINVNKDGSFDIMPEFISSLNYLIERLKEKEL